MPCPKITPKTYFSQNKVQNGATDSLNMSSKQIIPTAYQKNTAAQNPQQIKLSLKPDIPTRATSIKQTKKKQNAITYRTIAN